MASGEILSDEIEVEAHSYLNQVVSGGLPIDHVLDILIRFKESPVSREQETFTCMIRMILAHYKDLPTYSLNKVKIIAYLYGSLIKHRLVTEAYGTLIIALSNVFDALMEPPEANMFIFGSKALELFVERLRELPLYRNFAMMIHHFRTKCPNLVDFIESISPLKSNDQVLAQNVDVTAETPRTGSLYVYDLDLGLTDMNLYYIFSLVGIPIVSARVCRDAITRRSLGYGYVKYRDSHEAATAMQKLSCVTFMKVMCYQSIRRRGSTHVFFRSSDISIDDRALYDIFWSFGDIVSLEVKRHPSSGDSKGFGFVNFEDANCAAKAVEILNGKMIGDIKLRVEFARQRKEKRGVGVQAQISSQMTPSYMAPIFYVYNNTHGMIMASPFMATPLYNLPVTIGGQHLWHVQYPPPVLSHFRPLPQANEYFGYQQQQLVPGMQSSGITSMHPWGASVPNVFRSSRS